MSRSISPTLALTILTLLLSSCVQAHNNNDNNNYNNHNNYDDNNNNNNSNHLRKGDLGLCANMTGGAAVQRAIPTPLSVPVSTITYMVVSPCESLPDSYVLPWTNNTTNPCPSGTGAIVAPYLPTGTFYSNPSYQCFPSSSLVIQAYNASNPGNPLNPGSGYQVQLQVGNNYSTTTIQCADVGSWSGVSGNVTSGERVYEYGFSTLDACAPSPYQGTYASDGSRLGNVIFWVVLAIIGAITLVAASVGLLMWQRRRRHARMSGDVVRGGVGDGGGGSGGVLDSERTPII